MQFIKKVRWCKHEVWHILDIAKIIKRTTGIPSCFWNPDAETLCAALCISCATGTPKCARCHGWAYGIEWNKYAHCRNDASLHLTLFHPSRLPSAPVRRLSGELIHTSAFACRLYGVDHLWTLSDVLPFYFLYAIVLVLKRPARPRSRSTPPSGRQFLILNAYYSWGIIRPHHRNHSIGAHPNHCRSHRRSNLTNRTSLEARKLFRRKIWGCCSFIFTSAGISYGNPGDASSPM